MLLTAPDLDQVCVTGALAGQKLAGLLLTAFLPEEVFTPKRMCYINILGLPPPALHLRQTSSYGISRRRSYLLGCHFTKAGLKDWRFLPTTFIWSRWEDRMTAGSCFCFLARDFHTISNKLWGMEERSWGALASPPFWPSESFTCLTSLLSDPALSDGKPGGCCGQSMGYGERWK